MSGRGRGVPPSKSVSGRGRGVQGARLQRSVSVSTIPQTAAGSSRTLDPPSLPIRSKTPPTRVDRMSPPVESVDRKASTPVKEDTSASSIHPNLLDDTNVSAIPTGTVPKVESKSRKDRLEEQKKIKEDKERKCLIAQMEAVLASAELYEAQKAHRCPSDQEKVDEIKSEMAEKVELIKHYTFCLETIPSYIQAQAVVDDAKKKKEDLLGLLHGSNDSEPVTQEEITKMGEQLKDIKSSLERLKSELINKRIALPLDELEKALREASQLFKRIDDHKQINRALKKMTIVIAHMEKYVGHLEKLGGLLEEKKQLEVHLASLKTSLQLYEMKKVYQL
uniref:Uncharacterized protein n=1 Tax=Lygus hesperus TaxID=30085 RepID=A0A146LJN3_LYGHE